MVFEPVVDILTGFHPRSRPVLWRMLVAQAYVFCALTRLKYLEAAASEDSPTWKIEEIEAEKLDWRESAVDTDSDLALTQPFLVAKRYLRERL